MPEQPPTTPLDLSVIDGVATISGEIDLSSAHLVATWLKSPPVDPLHLDLRGVTFMDTLGLRTLVNARRINPTMRIVDSSTTVAKLLQITGLNEYFGASDLA